MKTPEARSPCPISRSLDILGDRWSLLVIRDLFCGRDHFKDFLASPEKIATNTLSDRLDRLQKAGLVDTYPSERFQGRKAYRLTPMGEGLRPMMDAMVSWGLEHIQGTKVGIQPKTPN